MIDPAKIASQIPHPSSESPLTVMQKTPSVLSCRTVIALMAVASSLPSIVTSAHAGEGGYGYSSLAQREMLRRQDAAAEGDRLLAEGREAYAKGDYQQAVDKYTQAVQRVPNAPAFADRRQSYIEHRGDASVALSMQHRKVGKYAEARTLLEAVIAQDPNNAEAKLELSYLDDPIRTNPALTYEHTQNVDEVRRKLYTAEGNYNLGKYDDAKREYENVLRIDPYNSAARRGMERIAAAKSDYYRAAYDHTRAELLSQVDAAWELAVPAELPLLPTGSQVSQDGGSGIAYINEKLRRINVNINFEEDATVEDAIDFLRMRSRELDNLELDPTRKGVNFIVRTSRAAPVAAPDAGLELGEGAAIAPPSSVGSLRVGGLNLRNVPLLTALDYICKQTKLRYKVDDFAVTIVPLTESGEDLIQRTFTVPPDFYKTLAEGGAGNNEAPNPFDDPGAGKDLKFAPRQPILDLLKQRGVDFPPGSIAFLSASGTTLTVKNTPTQLEVIESLVDLNIQDSPKQVKITSKFVEISQENTEELGFDWVLGGVGFGNPISGAGGTIGSGVARTVDDFTGDLFDVSPAPPKNIMTAGTRSGEGAINRNSIDAILNNPSRTAQTANVAPGILSLTGIFGDAEFTMMMRGLSQRKGADIMTAPSVTARSGQPAKIEVVREFMYPTEYEPPEVPQSVGSPQATPGGILPDTGGGVFIPVTPATPTAFETRNTGVTLDIQPTIDERTGAIDLEFKPEIVEFEGFINYGSPIYGADDSVLTENRIEMPVFSTRKVSSMLTVYDGYTFAVGGLMREDVQNVEDKVPILGDIPIVGRLFQTKAENRIKSNLIIFVTAQIIDATGRPLRGAEAAGTSLPVAAPAGGAEGAIDAGVLPPL
jgi:general secretion pathway protein D